MCTSRQLSSGPSCGLHINSVFRAPGLHGQEVASNLASPSAMQSVEGSGVATEYKSSGDILSGVKSHAFLSDNLLDESKFGGCQENITYLTALCQDLMQRKCNLIRLV